MKAKEKAMKYIDENSVNHISIMRYQVERSIDIALEEQAKEIINMLDNYWDSCDGYETFYDKKQLEIDLKGKYGVKD